MAKFLVTGGAGFIGSNLVDAILAQGDSVRVLDDFSSGYEANLAHVRDSIELMRGTIEDADVCARAVDGVDYILHEAALASVPQSVEDPIKNHRANVEGIFFLLLAARDAGVKRFVLASSAAIYGDNPTTPKVETLPPEPISPYAAAKLIGENYCQQFTASGWLECVCLRYFNIFGPRQDPKSDYAAVVPIFIQKMLEGDAPTIYGDGLQTRDFTFVENVVRANLLATQAPDAPGGFYNIGCGGSYSVRDLFDRIRDVLGVDFEPNYQPVRAGDVKDSRAAIELAKEKLGYEPVVSFEDGLARTCEWFRENAAVRARGG